MGTWIATVVVLLFFLIAVGNSSSNTLCIEKERSALLSFRQGLTDPSNRLSSWSFQKQEDCCRWIGVRCNNVTGHVVGLHLHNPYESIFNNEGGSYEMLWAKSLGGEINPSLLELEFLNYLDLSWNDFGATPIPSFFGSMTSLTILNLSETSFGGRVPHQLGNLSSLRYRHLGNLYSYGGAFVENLSWISGLHSLEYLNMDGLNFSKGVEWLQAMNTFLPSLSELHLSDCQLENMNPSLNYYVNLTSLAFLDLSVNLFNHELPNWLSNLSITLQHLDLSFNDLQGQIPSTMSDLRNLNYLDLWVNNLTGKIPKWLGQLRHLEHLSLSTNSFYGPIPATLGNLSSLMSLYIPYNHLNGNLPKNLGLLSHLETLSIGHNLLAGYVSEENFAKHSKLKILYMSSNSLFFNVSFNWVPPFQLEFMDISSCKTGPRFPVWLRTQTSLHTILDISKSGISDTAPDWFWNLASHSEELNLSDNQIDGDLSHVLLNSSVVNLSSNRFKGQLPRLSSNVQMLKIDNNSFSGSLSSFLCRKLNRRNNLVFLDVSNNHLLGGLSHCWMYWQSLLYINLERNNLSGKIPKSMGFLSQLISLHLRENRLSGDIPASLRNCTSLEFFDLGKNEFTGAIPSWMGERTSLLKVLCLRSNKFTGNIPKQICQLVHICILDLANNNLSGTIPKCLNNISSMIMTDVLDNFTVGPFGYDNVLMVVKGLEREYQYSQIEDMRNIDLSSNDLSGSIPAEITSLSALHLLNLSYNNLMGKMPANIGNMHLLESLDLSRNHLMGQIPQSMSILTFLSYLDLSYNNFSGRIPSGTQLQTFNATSYIGNAELCGAPLNNNCTSVEESPGPTLVGEGGNEIELLWFYIGMGTGFAAGFWGVCGVLFFKRNWRHAYFQFLDDMRDWIYVATMLKVNWFCQKSNSFANSLKKHHQPIR